MQVHENKNALSKKKNQSCTTLAKTEIIHPKNVGASVAMIFTSDKYSAPMAIEKIKILGANLELPS